ncbi:MAG: glycosyltransferase [Planctomycetia bacterium]|nr:glycosyltransferase [Planctomycetia bacterium]
MKILICSDSYYPSVGGVQVVLQQIAERLVKRGHQITVATSKLNERKSNIVNGVTIQEFDISGNFNRGLTGEVQKYCKFVLSENYDVLLMKAAQSWTFDALMNDFPKIKKRKVFIPCGFSGLYYPYYKAYYEKMPEVLRQFDHLIFYANDYRDVNFAREHKINNFSIIPNGASEIEFSTKLDISFRDRFGIGKNETLLLTVGTFTGGKGHFEVASAFQLAKIEKPATLILNGNLPDKKAKLTKARLAKEYLKMGLRSMLRRIFNDILVFVGIKNVESKRDWNDIAQEVNTKDNDKNIIITNLNRKDLVQCFLNSDLFVFASNIEYSPLVLFESAAAGLPFLSVPVGNAVEIAEWTQGGVICTAPSDINGRTTVDPQILANKMSALLKDKKLLETLGRNGRKNWQKHFTWDHISLEYEKVLLG